MDTAQKCRRCGTCCKKGGPSFHQQDKFLIEKGLISAKYLYTIRQGEMARDNIKAQINPVSSDIIKIKGKMGKWECIFFDEINKCCTIYDNRPLECRVLKCWDTQEIEKIHRQARLTRKDLLGHIAGLWDTIQEHQIQCDYKTVQETIRTITNAPKEKPALNKLYDMLNYDIDIRSLALEKAGVAPDMLDFLFGRPLTKTVEALGITVKKEGKCFFVRPKH